MKICVIDFGNNKIVTNGESFIKSYRTDEKELIARFLCDFVPEGITVYISSTKSLKPTKEDKAIDKILSRWDIKTFTVNNQRKAHNMLLPVKVNSFWLTTNAKRKFILYTKMREEKALTHLEHVFNNKRFTKDCLPQAVRLQKLMKYGEVPTVLKLGWGLRGVVIDNTVVTIFKRVK